MSLSKINILFMCVANSARSQIAEALTKKKFGEKVHVESAGSCPTRVNPYTIQILKEINIDISKNFSKSCEQLPQSFVSNLDYVITLCAEEVCPLVIGGYKTKKLHWSFADPANKEGVESEKLQRFREIRDAIEEKIQEFNIAINGL